MSWLRELRLLWWFTSRDLFQHRRSWRVSLVQIANVAFLVTFTLPIYGLVLGYEVKRTEQLRRDPLARCLWLGRSGLSEPIRPADLDRLRRALEEALPGEGAACPCWPFHVFALDWFDLQDEQLSRSFRGRTLAEGDPLLESCALLSGRRFQEVDEEGVLVSAEMLGALNAPKEGAVGRLRFRFRAANPSVPVVGVLEQPLPGNLHFLFTEAGEARMRRQNPNPQVASAFSGRLPPDLAEMRRPPMPVLNWFEKCEVHWVCREPREGGTVWRLTTENGAELPLHVWRSHLEGARRVLKDLGNDPGEEFAAPAAAVAARATDEQRSGYAQAVVYVQNLEQLMPAARAAESVNLHPDMDVIRQLERVARATYRTMLAVTLIVLFLGLLAVGNLYVIHDLRSRERVRDVGLLKMIGMEEGTLRSVFLLEAAVLWLAGVLPGLALGWLGGHVLAACWVQEETREPLMTLSTPPLLLLAIVTISALACVLSCWWATRPARKESPLRSLSTG